MNNYFAEAGLLVRAEIIVKKYPRKNCKNSKQIYCEDVLRIDIG